jgi:uncharacterized oligopeptide transporter (OPT) family protein
MSLFQRPPVTPEELDSSKPIELAPEQVDAMDEREWYARAFRGDASQLTVRAVLTGSLLGFVLAATNVYVGLKVGLGFGVALTACVASFTIWTSLHRSGVVRSPLTILECNCMQSTASSAGAATTPLLTSAFPAMLLLSVTEGNPQGTHVRWYIALAWVLTVAALGVLMAIPMKRTMINRERLKFPSGTAAAVLMKSLYTEGAEALAKGRALLVAGALGGAVTLLRDLKWRARAALLPKELKIFDWLPRLPVNVADAATHTTTRAFFPLSALHITFEPSAMAVAAGAIVGLRTALSMVAGGALLVFAIGPASLAVAWPGKPLNPATLTSSIGTWFGAAIMVAHGLTLLALDYRSLGRALRGLLPHPATEQDAGDGVEVPVTWFVMGTSIAGAVVVVLAWLAFGIPMHYGALAVILAFFLALVACRATGETDFMPSGPLGKVMQMTYGVLMPQSYTANLMTASLTAGASVGAADLLNDLKSGYLLGAHPRRQFIAQLLGIVSGTLASVLCFFILVPDATALTQGPDGAPPFPAPAARNWVAVADLFRLGVGRLHPMAREGITIGLIAGFLLAVAEWALPRKKKWLPSATGVGLGFLLPFSMSLSFLIGAAAAWAFGLVSRKPAARFLVPVAAGLIAGESLVGVLVAAFNAFVAR